FKKTSKNIQSKKANKRKMASLESTRSTSLSESFSERFDNLGVNDNSGSNLYSNAKMFESYKRMLARIIEKQEEFFLIKDKVKKIKNHLNNLEQKMDNSFNITNDKAFKEDTIKGAAKALIEKAIYSENSQIKSEVEKYV
ncbi:41981_t:CDS:2, partial [Gigaspora margarita]